MRTLPATLRRSSLAVVLLLLLSACGDAGQEVVVDAGTKIVEKDSPRADEFEIDPDTGEAVSENDGPLDPATLDPALADPLYLLPGCENESVARVVDRIPWDYDGDGAKDLVVVTRCSQSDAHNVVVMRATSRGWRPKRTVGPEIQPTLITGDCRVDETAGQVRCAARSFNPVTQEPSEAVMVIQRLQGEWFAELA